MLLQADAPESGPFGAKNTRGESPLVKALKRFEKNNFELDAEAREQARAIRPRRRTEKVDKF